MAHWLFLPDDAFDDLTRLAKLAPDKLPKLRALLDSSEFELRYKFFVKLADQLGVSDEAAAKLCSFINYVQVQRARNNEAGESVPGELEYFLRAAGKQAEEAELVLKYIRDNRDTLAQLFSEPALFESAEKLRGLETGPLPHLDSVRTYCDLRPVYDKHADKIVSTFPVITLSLTIHDTTAEEMKDILVQLTESDLKEFRKQFNRLDKKLAKLKELYGRTNQ